MAEFELEKSAGRLSGGARGGTKSALDVPWEVFLVWESVVVSSPFGSFDQSVPLYGSEFVDFEAEHSKARFGWLWGVESGRFGEVVSRFVPQYVGMARDPFQGDLWAFFSGIFGSFDSPDLTVLTGIVGGGF